MKKIYCRTASSLGALEDTPENIWGTPEYKGDTDEPCVFFGLYGLPDFYSLWRHAGKKYILWTGSDIRHFLGGYWLDDLGYIRINPQPYAQWIQKYCESWVENDVEQKALQRMGIHSRVCPSFLGDVSRFELSYKHSDKPKLYSSVSGDDYTLYGWDKIYPLANKNPDIDFHLYGNTKECPTNQKNVIIHGRVPKEQMNEEIKTMQGALRLTEFDGFSEIIAKSVLMGQYPVSLIPYPHMLSVNEIGTLKDRRESNIVGRNYYSSILNNFPWNCKKKECHNEYDKKHS